MAKRCQTAILIHIYHVKAKFSLLQRWNAETLQKALVVFSHLACNSIPCDLVPDFQVRTHHSTLCLSLETLRCLALLLVVFSHAIQDERLLTLYLTILQIYDFHFASPIRLFGTCQTDTCNP
ncbi:unnamed protein product [Albugo candida]|uniref:Uncharacterized protein n=1 Tax=Albugo candida TaxID=65357 RepID=A0A024FVQ6_9STRA|nr:unnamed protein product [Albugo candida]|eukprot:CCI11111.1 unnamed protein product [Albugo candida]